ncbi:F-actin capping protein, beta subunit [Violaceomyces palustris]|uniref:F-actin capping protein, beta subunit n=1 Tax=Violaceomyces palustris TaxID=1673888 RepID=A0ACD0P5G6_9BASI|nr:F-actin capping protein, beta subunit [Violaceomyces palustris]
MSDPLDLSLDLLRRLPPSSIPENLERIVNLIPAYADDLYSSVDQPLKVKVDSTSRGGGAEFLCCDYNRDGDSWRSWRSNTYHPPINSEDRDDGQEAEAEDGEELVPGTRPSSVLRQLEIKANDAFETYSKLYYDSALSSVYLWDLDSDPSSLTAASSTGVAQAPSTFAGVVLFKKEIGESSGNGTYGTWDSLHVFEATERPGASSKSGSSGGGSATYKLTSTVMLGLRRTEAEKEGDSEEVSAGKVGSVEIAGSLTRQSEADYPLPDFVSHISNVGKMIEDMEAKMRNQLQEVYFGKTRDVVGHLRSVESLEKNRRAKELQKELMGLWKK